MKVAVVTAAMTFRRTRRRGSAFMPDCSEACGRLASTRSRWTCASTSRPSTSVLASYVRCYDLDLRQYDLVISTKAPTYLVRHPRHVSYLVHTLRVFYDRFAGEFGDGDRRVETSARA